MDAKTLRSFLGGLDLIVLGLSNKLWLIGVIQNLKQIYDGLETFNSVLGISIETITGALNRKAVMLTAREASVGPDLVVSLPRWASAAAKHSNDQTALRLFATTDQCWSRDFSQKRASEYRPGFW
jgi:hypothetical protein